MQLQDVSIRINIYRKSCGFVFLTAYNEEDVERVRVELEELRNKPPVQRNYSIEYVEKFKQDWRKMQRSFGYAE